MKKTIISFLLTLSILHASGQIKAVTSNGDEVILNSDGTWKYVNDSVQAASRIDTNRISFSKNAIATFLVKSNKVNCGIYLNPKKWAFTKSSADEASEYEFTLKGKDAYAMLITEKIEVPIETLNVIAIENAKEAAPDIKIVKQEYRKVNNNMILLIQMDGTIQGIKFTYLGYYFSSSKGTLQLITYTATNLVNEYKNDLEELLNGLVTIGQ